MSSLRVFMKFPFGEIDPVKAADELARLAKEDPEALDRLEKQVKDYRVELARNDPNEFVSYVMRDEETQEPLRLAPYHRKLQDAVSSHSHVVIWGHNECGKTQLISIGRVLWEIGHNPAIRVCIIQAAEHLAESVVSTIKRYIEFSQEFKDVFPDIRRGDLWTSTSFNVERPGTIKDPTVIATGVHGNILGRRFDLVICHELGTPILHQGEWIPVEKHPTAQLRNSDGITVGVYGLPFTETVTPEHRYWVMDTVTRTQGWVQADQLKTTDAIGYPIDSRVEPPAPISCCVNNLVSTGKSGITNNWQYEYRHQEELYDPDWWWLLGLWWGDGHKTKHQIGFTLSCEVTTARLINVLERYGYKHSISHRKGCWQLTTPTTRWARWLASWRSGNSKKAPPSWVETLDTRLQAALVRGYIDSDGYISSKCNEVKITSIHLPGLLMVRRILARLGVPSSIRRGPGVRVEAFGTRLSVAQPKYDIRFHSSYGHIFGLGEPRFRNNLPIDRFNFIESGYAWSRVRSLVSVKDRVFVPIQTDDHTYITAFGKSHNCDDVVTGDNSATEYMRDDVFKWLQSTPMSRLTSKARIWVLGNAWQTSDAMHRFAKMDGWRSYKFPARHPVTGESYWLERWPQERFISWAATRTSWETARTLDCFPKGTLVLTGAGYTPIEDVKVGDFALTHKGRWREVTNVMVTKKPLLTIKGHGHPGLSVSGEHPFYVRERGKELIKGTRNYRPVLSQPCWKNAETLVKGDYWATPVTYPDSEAPTVPMYDGRTLEVTEDLMWLAGRYVADGWVSERPGQSLIVITCGHHKTNQLRSRLNKWPRKGIRASAEEMVWHERDTSTAHQFITCFKGLAEWLIVNFGIGAAHKRVPSWVLGLSSGMRQHFVDGYVSGDGCIDEKRGTVDASTVSKQLAFGLKAVVVSLGYTVTVGTKEGGTSVIQGRTVNTLRSWKIRWRTSRATNYAQTWRSELHEWTAIKHKQGSATNQPVEVYNLSVDEDESYVVEGIVVHNCIPYSEEAGRFRKIWFEQAIEQGRGLFGEAFFCPALAKLPPGCSTYTGVDLGISERMGTDKTVIFTVMVDPEGLITVLNIHSGNWEADQICRHIVDAHTRFKSFVFVESLFAQRWILQLLRKTHPNIPVFPFQTRGGGNSRANKRHTVFGVESVAAELAQGLWKIPSTKSTGAVSNEVKEWMSGCLEYDPESHTSDFLMACVLPGHQVMTERGPVAIEAICVGDKVLTHKGRFRAVTKTMSRPYTGATTKLYPVGGVAPLVLTDDHPVYAASKHKAFSKKATFTLHGLRDWVAAGDLKVPPSGKNEAGWTGLRPVAQGDGVSHISIGGGVSVPLTEEVCVLLGLFLAEGSTSGQSAPEAKRKSKKHVVSFAFHEEETWLHEYVAGHASTFKVSATTRPSAETKCTRVDYYGTTVALFFEQFGTKSWLKAVPWALWWSLSASQKLAVARGWLMGDGSSAVTRAGGVQIKGATTSYALVQQMLDAMLCNGLHAACSRRVYTKPTKFNGYTFIGRDLYLLMLPTATVVKLSSQWLGVEKANWPTPKPGHRNPNIAVWFNADGVASKLGVEEGTYTGLVYNLHVDEDESYVCENIAVHNCWMALQGARQHTGSLGYNGAVTHDSWVELETEPDTDEQRLAKQKEDNFLFRQKQAEGFWGDIADELNLPARSPSQIAEDLGVGFDFPTDPG